MHYPLQPHPCRRERKQRDTPDPANASQAEPLAAPCRRPAMLRLPARALDTAPSGIPPLLSSNT
eukprot:6024039-Alexandrium_andersonii.AAC.1